jgi:RNA polymerase sigma factor (sigma-70 family)
LLLALAQPASDNTDANLSWSKEQMASGSSARTSVSLLGRLRQESTDQAAWAEFVRRYGHQIYRWCLKWRLQEADAEDVTQTVLVKLAEKMRTFSYDSSRSFRAYLKTLTHYAWRDFLESRKGAAGSGDTQVMLFLQTIAARDDLLEHLHAEFDQELLEEAIERVQERVEPHTWAAFRLTAIDGLSGAAVAEQLKMKVTTVFKAKSKVQKMLQEEVKRLEESPRDG